MEWANIRYICLYFFKNGVKLILIKPFVHCLLCIMNTCKENNNISLLFTNRNSEFCENSESLVILNLLSTPCQFSSV